MKGGETSERHSVLELQKSPFCCDGGVGVGGATVDLCPGVP